MNKDKKNEVLKVLARLLRENEDKILKANKKDILHCKKIDESLLDRLKIDKNKIESMATSVEKTINFEDPEGKVLFEFDHENGMKIQNKTVSFGNILIIYESRPDVTIEASILAFKAGNKVFLKGGKEASNSNKFLVSLWQKALEEVGLDKNRVEYLDLSRTKTQEIIKNNTLNLDLIIPRGGEGLIKFVRENAKVPVIVSGRGNNFAFVDKEVNFSQAVEIILNGKSRISVCNALDKVLVDKNLKDLEKNTKKLVSSLVENNIEVFGDKEISQIDTRVSWVEKEEEILAQEFLSSKIYIKIVKDLGSAIEIINTYSGGHSAVIISKNKENASVFQDRVDCAAVYHNASTRFTDGGEFGFGAEIAISTQKLHFRGPIGLEQLVTNKWYISGNGQIR